MGIEERREHKRVYIRFKVECRGKKYWQYVDAMNISAGGMFIFTEKLEPLETKLEVMFEFGDGIGKLIKADAVVAWVREKTIEDINGDIIKPAGMGLKFTKVSPLTAKEYINQVVAASNKESGGG
ncbi:MAG: PilZ domain-containing protein [Candidatus Omnitrophota bacterium]